MIYFVPLFNVCFIKRKFQPKKEHCVIMFSPLCCCSLVTFFLNTNVTLKLFFCFTVDRIFFLWTIPTPVNNKYTLISNDSCLYVCLQAECCSDHLHCCYQGTLCDLEHSKCVNKTHVLNWVERVATKQVMHIPATNSDKPWVNTRHWNGSLFFYF